jgi:hypothetical protein
MPGPASCNIFLPHAIQEIPYSQHGLLAGLLEQRSRLAGPKQLEIPDLTGRLQPGSVVANRPIKPMPRCAKDSASFSSMKEMPSKKLAGFATMQAT